MPQTAVFYPCLELGHYAGNLLSEPNLHLIRRSGCEKFGPQPDCGTQCHSACALGFARILANPLSLMHEGLLMAMAKTRQAAEKAGTVLESTPS
jgi:hypothetical protein